MALIGNNKYVRDLSIVFHFGSEHTHTHTHNVGFAFEILTSDKRSVVKDFVSCVLVQMIASRML